MLFLLTLYWQNIKARESDYSTWKIFLKAFQWSFIFHISKKKRNMVIESINKYVFYLSELVIQKSCNR